MGPTSLLVTVVPNNQNAKYSGCSAGARPLPPDQLKCNILKGTMLLHVRFCLAGCGLFVLTRTALKLLYDWRESHFARQINSYWEWSLLPKHHM